MKTQKIIYWIVTGLFSLMILLGGLNFIFNTEEVAKTVFEPLGFPAAMVLPLGIAKVIGAIALLINKLGMIKNLAYLGIFADLIAALVSHLNANDGMWYAPVLPLVLGMISFILWRKTLK
ncbi:MAG: DoxX family protein [Ekhidna sp.]